MNRPAAAAPAPTLPAIEPINLLDFMFGLALLEQGFTGTQAAELIGTIRFARAAGCSEWVTTRFEQHTARSIAAPGN